MRAWLALALVVPMVVSAQTRDEEIKIARSAAPPDIAKDAKVYVLDHGHYVVADPGRSNEACFVARPSPADFAPMCGDAEADATEFAVGRFQTEQQLAGKSKAEIAREVEDGMKSGRFREPKRPALVFMLSSAQQLTNPDGKPVGKWYPHIMVFAPGMTNEAMGIDPNSNDVNMPNVGDSGKPGSVLIVIERNWNDPAGKQVSEKSPGN